MKNIEKVYRFVKEVEKLKTVVRTAWASDGRKESTAEHSWRLAMFVMTLGSDVEDLDINKAIKMALVHDLGEIYDGDVSAKYQSNVDAKVKSEEKAIRKLADMLPEDIGKEIYSLCREYNEAKTKEAQLIKALDKIETITQHNQGLNPNDFDYEFNLNYGKKYCKEDEMLMYLRNLVDNETKLKIIDCN